MKEKTPLNLFILSLLVGLTLILKSTDWGLGSIESMTIAGTILSVLGSFGILLERYLYRK